MTEDVPRLQRRIAKEFPEPGSAHGVQMLLDSITRQFEGTGDPAGIERVQAAAVLLAGGSLAELREAVVLGRTDWRDLLVAAGLAHDDWPARLDEALGPK